jgi:hypothetical protein
LKRKEKEVKQQRAKISRVGSLVRMEHVQVSTGRVFVVHSFIRARPRIAQPIASEVGGIIDSSRADLIYLAYSMFMNVIVFLKKQ